MGRIKDTLMRSKSSKIVDRRMEGEKRMAPKGWRPVKGEENVYEKRPARNRAHEVPRYFVAPRYGEYSEKSGASWMDVVIGPGQGVLGMYGSKPAPNTPRVMRALLDNGKLNDYGWIAGHLLNDNLGGPGVSWNLTPLTTAGNKNHLNICETLIKNFIWWAHSRSLYYKSDEYFYGVHYSVTVSEEKWFDEYPLDCVAKWLLVSGRVVKQKKGMTDYSPAEASEMPSNGVWFAPFTDAKVDNTGYDTLQIEY